MLATADPRPAPFGLEAGTGCLKGPSLRIYLSRNSSRPRSAVAPTTRTWKPTSRSRYTTPVCRYSPLRNRAAACSASRSVKELT